MPYQWMSREETAMVAEAMKEQIKIQDYAASIGYTPVKKGKYISLKEIDSIRIDPKKNCFYRNSGIGGTTKGSVIDFAMNVNGMNFHEAFMELKQYANLDLSRDYPTFSPDKKAAEQSKKKAIQRELKLPERGQNMRRVYAYLLKSRFLEPDVVQDFVSRKMLYQDIRNNCCFVGYDDVGNPNYGFLRGTSTQNRFVGDVPGCDYEKGFYIHNGSNKLIISESVIDAASVMSVLHAQGYDFKEYDYYALTGSCKLEGIFSRIKEGNYEQILMAPDNDEAGKISVQKMNDFLKENQIETEFSEHFPVSKDWNQDLVNVRSKFGDIHTLHFFPMTEAELEIPKEPQIYISSFHKEGGRTLAKGHIDGKMFDTTVWRKGNQLLIKLPDGYQHNFTDQEAFRLKRFSEKYNQQYLEKMKQQELQKDQGLDI